MRTLLRSHADSMAYLPKRFQRRECHLQYEESERQSVDIFSKAFHTGESWDHTARLIGVGARLW